MRIFTLKNKTDGLMLDWTLVWPSNTNPNYPTHQDFKNKYGDGYYAPFHKDEEIVELVENH